MKQKIINEMVEGKLSILVSIFYLSIYLSFRKYILFVPLSNKPLGFKHRTLNGS